MQRCILFIFMKAKNLWRHSLSYGCGAYLSTMWARPYTHRCQRNANLKQIRSAKTWKSRKRDDPRATSAFHAQKIARCTRARIYMNSKFTKRACEWERKRTSQRIFVENRVHWMDPPKLLNQWPQQIWQIRCKPSKTFKIFVFAAQLVTCRVHWKPKQKINVPLFRWVLILTHTSRNKLTPLLDSQKLSNTVRQTASMNKCKKHSPT